MTTRRLFTSLLCGAFGVLLASLGLLQAQEAPKPYQNPYQKVLVDNAFVRVLEVNLPPGVFEEKHSHPHGIQIAMSDYDNEVKTFPDGQVTKAHHPIGEVKWQEPVTHEVRNTGTTVQHVIRIELK